jgi:hypothetical protein
MVEGSNAFVGLAITGSNANLFFCGKGATLASQTHWIPGTVKSGEAFHFTDGVASATGSTTATHASGTFTPSASSQPLSWSADIVVSGTAAGIYDEQNSEGNAALTVIQPSASTAPIAQGAYLPNDVKDAIAQVTPFGKIYVSKQGVPVDVPINGSTKEWYLPPATGN